MSNAFKNRLEVQKVLRGTILSALEKLGHTGWGCAEFSSPQYVSFDKCVLMNLVRSEKIGNGGIVYQRSNDSLIGKVEWIDRQHWQIHIIAKRKLNATSSTIVPEDIANELVAYLNTFGVDEFRKCGCAPERIDTTTIFIYNDDNEIYQKRAVFTLKLQVPKELSIMQDEMTPKSPYVLPNEHKSGEDKTSSAKGFGHFPV